MKRLTTAFVAIAGAGTVLLFLMVGAAILRTWEVRHTDELVRTTSIGGILVAVAIVLVGAGVAVAAAAWLFYRFLMPALLMAAQVRAENAKEQRHLGAANKSNSDARYRDAQTDELTRPALPALPTIEVHRYADLEESDR